MTVKEKSRRGFGSWDKAKQQAVARKGGLAAHASGKAHEWTPEAAREAGRIGGEIVARDRKHMSEIGRRGGISRGKKQKEKMEQVNE